MAEKEITFDTGRARYSYTSGEQNRHGKGGQAELFIGTNLDNRQKVAIRLIDLEVKNATIWFQREKNFIGNLKHPNIVEVLDYYESADNLGRLFGYIIQEFIHGETLAKKMKDWQNSSQPTQHQGEEQFQIMIDALSGLDYLHRKEIIHRDISPNNIMVADNGHVKIIDFGLAKDVNDTTTSYTIVAPSPGIYSPPEMGTPALKAHPTMDIYAIAVVFYEMLAGVKLHSSRSIPLSKKPTDHEFSGQLDEHPNIHPQLLQVLKKATDMHKERRFQTVQEFQQALLSIRDQVLQAKAGIQNKTKAAIPKQELKPNSDTYTGNIDSQYLLQEWQQQYRELWRQKEVLDRMISELHETLQQNNISFERRNELKQVLKSSEESAEELYQDIVKFRAKIESLQRDNSLPNISENTRITSTLDDMQENTLSHHNERLGNIKSAKQESGTTFNGYIQVVKNALPYLMLYLIFSLFMAVLGYHSDASKIIEDSQKHLSQTASENVATSKEHTGKLDSIISNIDSGQYNIAEQIAINLIDDILLKCSGELYSYDIDEEVERIRRSIMQTSLFKILWFPYVNRSNKNSESSNYYRPVTNQGWTELKERQRKAKQERLSEGITINESLVLSHIASADGYILYDYKTSSKIADTYSIFEKIFIYCFAPFGMSDDTRFFMEAKFNKYQVRKKRLENLLSLGKHYDLAKLRLAHTYLFQGEFSKADSIYNSDKWFSSYKDIHTQLLNDYEVLRDKNLLGNKDILIHLAEANYKFSQRAKQEQSSAKEAK